MARLRKKPPPIRVLVLDAIRHGAGTSARLQDLLGLSQAHVTSTISKLAREKRIERAGIAATGRRGAPAIIWGAR